ncbi:MAG: PrgI family protein [Syntrophothermus sp.]|uniref:PrgI family mobile element protein n=1 Tax=Syntrophothermus sp. TaxID=2736299 RepID=UPI00257BD1D5|nr:PrgI family protein [Syntrophothermus sp.]NSW82756.1 PrgI family protein [Syntrophothermus sp.]
MSYGQYHPLPYGEEVGEQILGGLTFSQAGWLLAGLVASHKMAMYVPRLPLPNSLFLFSMIHWLIPLVISAVFAFVKMPQGVSIGAYLVSWYRFKKRRRVLVNRKILPEKRSDLNIG